MRIALAHPHVWPDVRRGAERYVDDLAWYLAAQGHGVEIITGTEGPHRTEHRPDGVVVHHRHHVGLVKLAAVGVDRVQAFLLTALPVLRSGRYDVVHAMVPGAACAGWVARTPTVFTYIGHPTRSQLDDLPRTARWLHRAADRTATVTTALSAASAASVAGLFGRRPEVLAPGVRLDRFPAGTSPATGPPVLLFSAAPGDRRKHLDLLLRAMPVLLASHPDARVVVSGQGDPAWALDGLTAADRTPVEQALDLAGTGSVEDLPARYRAATVTVLPAVDEAFGLSLVESLASGTPVVATADGGMTDIVTDPAVGRTFPAGSVEGLARALLDAIDLATAPTTAGACAAHARRWGWSESIGPQHEALYEQVAQRARVSRPA